MEVIRTLQRQFEAASQQYAGLNHVLMVWQPESGNKQSVFQAALDLKLPRPAPQSRIVTTYPNQTGNEAESLICQVWQYGSGLDYIPGMDWAHFLFQDWGQSWDKNKAINALSNAAKLLGNFLIQAPIVSQIDLPEQLQRPSDPVERALIALHEFGPVDVYAYPELQKPVLTVPMVPLVNQFLTSRKFHYFGVIQDVWTGSSLLCARLLELPRDRRSALPDDNLPTDYFSERDSVPAQPEIKNIEGKWSKPMSKSAMRNALKIDGCRSFDTFAKQQGIRQAGNRQLWQIRLDTMDEATRKKLEKA